MEGPASMTIVIPKKDTLEQTTLNLREDFARITEQQVRDSNRCYSCWTDETEGCERASTLVALQSNTNSSLSDRIDAFCARAPPEEQDVGLFFWHLEKILYPDSEITVTKLVNQIKTFRISSVQHHHLRQPLLPRRKGPALQLSEWQSGSYEANF
jgi:hypothetical protein